MHIHTVLGHDVDREVRSTCCSDRRSKYERNAVHTFYSHLSTPRNPRTTLRPQAMRGSAVLKLFTLQLRLFTAAQWRGQHTAQCVRECDSQTSRARHQRRCDQSHLVVQSYSSRSTKNNVYTMREKVVLHSCIAHEVHALLYRRRQSDH